MNGTFYIYGIKLNAYQKIAKKRNIKKNEKYVFQSMIMDCKNNFFKKIFYPFLKPFYYPF